MNGAISPLKRHILLRLLGAVGLLSTLLLITFLSAYRTQLLNERSQASLGFNLLLQAALENAMLKRDVPGLADIVASLGRQPGIRGVMILHPLGEVRFASDADQIGTIQTDLLPTADAKPSADFSVAADGTEVLRSINPVKNKPPCQQCHGVMEKNPLNGVLVVDYDAHEIRAQAMKSALAFAGAGISVLILIMAILWRSLNRQVLEPVAALVRASSALERGELAQRVNFDKRIVQGEIAGLGQCFNRMAQRLEQQLARLRAHESYLQDVLDSLPDGIRVIRVSDMQVMLANRAFCQQTGKSAGAVIGNSCYASSHNRDSPCIATLHVCPLHHLTQMGETLKLTDYHQRSTGAQFPVEVHAIRTPLNSGDGSEEFIIESIRDLGQMVQISHEQRLSELGLLAAGIAHEIHNPLGSVRLGVQGLLREIAEGECTRQTIVNYMDLIDQEIDNCITITRRLLLLARPPSGSQQLVVLTDALNDTIRLLEYDAQTHGIKQCVELCETPLRILADESEVRMIFLNLIQNAHHAMPQGGDLRVTLRQEDGDAIVEISDSGVGMTPEILRNIYDPFFSLRADGVAGTGLGLTIVKNFIERMNGTISVTSTPGQGSCFRICLGLADKAKENDK